MAAITSPLRVHPDNPRYFTHDGTRAVYLAGSHTWANLQDIGRPGDPAFPYGEYLDFMEAQHHNFMRFWMFEQPNRAPWMHTELRFDPLPWTRPGPGLAADGLPRFDLDTFNEAYFARMRERLIEAGERGIYCAVMLFQGFSLQKLPGNDTDPWPMHPFNAANNVNGVDVAFTAMDDDEHPSLHSLGNPAALARQEAYVRKVVSALNDLDNVLYEIINEGGAIDWQYHMIDLVHELERGLPKQHPVGMTHRIAPNHLNAALFASNAEWISPASEPAEWNLKGAQLLEDYRADPPAADGRKVIVSDTDHLWGHGGNPVWAWKSFLRGHHTLFMDPWWPLYLDVDSALSPWVFTGGVNKDVRDYPDWDPTRRALGDTLRYAEKINLAAMTPHPEWSSTRYCLAHPGHEYLFYAPQPGPITLNLGAAPAGSRFAVEWFFPALGRTQPGAFPLAGGDYVVTEAPYTGDAVLYLKRT